MTWGRKQNYLYQQHLHHQGAVVYPFESAILNGDWIGEWAAHAFSLGTASCPQGDLTLRQGRVRNEEQDLQI